MAITEDTAPQVPTLEDVARRAGVSTATVSRCLNAPDRLSEETRKKVLRAVHDLGYAPNFGARALAAKRTNTFGAIIPTMENAIFARGLQAFQDELGAHGITLLVASSSYRMDTEEEQIRALVARGADALLLIGFDRTPATYAFLDQRQIPYVAAWVHSEAQTPASIGFDNRAAMRALAEAVIDLGHRSLAWVTADAESNDRARGRTEGVIDAMRARGLDPSELRIVMTPYSIGNGATAFEQVMRDPNPPTAVLCGNDVLAAGALRQAREMNLSVPSDVSITGFDNIELAEIVTPSLTTVDVPHQEMGRGAARMLIDLRNGVVARSGVPLQTTLKWRESLGPAPR